MLDILPPVKVIDSNTRLTIRGTSETIKEQIKYSSILPESLKLILTASIPKQVGTVDNYVLEYNRNRKWFSNDIYNYGLILEKGHQAIYKSSGRLNSENKVI